MTAYEPLIRSLEDYRAEQLLGVGEFALLLGITQQTYRRLLRHPETVRNKTKRQVLARLGLASPYLVAELAATASPAVVAQIHDIVERANQDGWIVCTADEPLKLIR